MQIFSIIPLVFGVTGSFRNHSHMLIFYAGNMYYYYPCWKYFFRILDEYNLFETEIFCNIINVVTVTFDQYNESLLIKSINFFQTFEQ